MKDEQIKNAFAEYAVGEAEPLTAQEEAEQKYLAKSGISDAIMAGLAEGLSFGWSNEIQSAYEQMLGMSDKEGYVPPERKTALLKAQSPTAYMLSDIAGSVATAALPIPGTSARLGTRIAAEAAKGALEGAGRAKEGERLEKAATMAGIGAGIGALGGAGAKYLEKSKQAKADQALIQAGKAAKDTVEGKALASIEKKLDLIDKKLVTLPGEAAAQKIKQAEEISESILKTQREIAELEAKGFVPGLAEKKKELEALQQTLSKQASAVAGTEEALAGVGQRFQVDPKELAKMQDAILKKQQEIAKLEAQGVVPGLAEKKKELEALQQTLSKQTGAVTEAEQALTGVAQRFEVDPKELAKMQEAILKGRQEVARLAAQGTVEVPQELLDSLARAEKQFADATRRVQASEKGIFDVEEQLARLGEKEFAAAQPAQQAGLFAPQPTGDLPGIAAARGEEMAVAGLRQRELEKRLTEQQFAQKAMDDYRMAIEQAKKQPPKMPTDLPFAQERLALAEAAPKEAAEAAQRAMQAETARLQAQLASGQASAQETQQAINKLMQQIDELTAGPKQFPPELPYVRQQLAAAEAAPRVAQETMQQAMEAEVARLQGQLASGQASKQETQQAIEMLMKQVDELTAAPKQMPTALPFKQQELAALMARKATPEAVPAEVLERSLREQIPQLDQARTAAYQLFNKKLEELSNVELNKLEQFLGLTLPGTKLTRPVTALEAAEAGARTGAARYNAGR